MESVEKLLNDAYKYLSAISVHGDSVDYLAMARQNIRAAYDSLKNQKEEEQ